MTFYKHRKTRIKCPECGETIEMDIEYWIADEEAKE